MEHRLLIATSNESDAKGLSEAFTNLEEIRPYPVVNTGRAAVDALLAKDVDLLLLDLFLPEVDGLGVLDAIDRLKESRRPLVFIISAVNDDRLLLSIRNRAIYCFIKPLSYELVQLRVLQLMNTAWQSQVRVSYDAGLLETKIAACVRAVGVPAHLRGYFYLRDAIRIYATSPNAMELNITTHIYPAVARLHNTRPKLVEHAIRTAIETAWNRGRLDTLHDYFGYTVDDCKGKPSNLEFVAMMAERIKTDLVLPRER